MKRIGGCLRVSTRELGRWRVVFVVESGNPTGYRLRELPFRWAVGGTAVGGRWETQSVSPCPSSCEATRR